jgi:hypothetical protein
VTDGPIPKAFSSPFIFNVLPGSNEATDPALAVRFLV